MGSSRGKVSVVGRATEADDTAAVFGASVWLLLWMQFLHSVISIQRRALASCPVVAVICARLELIKRRKTTRCFAGSILNMVGGDSPYFFFPCISFSSSSPWSSSSLALTRIFVLRRQFCMLGLSLLSLSLSSLSPQSARRSHCLAATAGQHYSSL